MGSFKVNQDKFDLVKTLLKAGVKKGQIQSISGLSNCTVNNIDKAENLSHYQDIVREQFAKKKAYDDAKANAPKVQEGSKKSYTVTMVINVDEEHEKLVAPLTALVNNMFDSDDVAVEAQQR